MATNKGFIKDWLGNTILPITRGELVVDSEGNIALASDQFLAQDGHPGLVTAAERAMINGSLSGEGSLADLYNKIDYINDGLWFNDTAVHFYNENGVSTPIKINSTGSNKLSINISNDNSVNFGLYPLTSAETSITQIIKKIIVDKYGRVTSVEGGGLLNSDLPATIESKTITNSNLVGCYTTEVSDNSTSLVNKEYVDTKFAEATGVATGSLKFGGILNNAQSALDKLSDARFYDFYYKVTGDFTLNKSNIYEPSDVLGESVNLKVGDTLIVYKSSTMSSAQFVYIPSADDITTISIKKDNGDSVTNILQYETGNVSLKFSSIFDITNSSTGTASINLLPASSTQSGYLSKEDWTKFNSYATQLGTSYVGQFDTGEGIYTIGTLTIGGVDHTIYGKNNISSLSLQTSSNNPTLKFTETGQSDVNIILKGATGIQVQKNNNDIEFKSLLTTPTQSVPDTQRSVNYITLNSNHQLKANIGTVNEDGTIVDGLTDYSEFVNLRTAVLTSTLVVESITYSLKGEANAEEYRYGNAKLKSAISITV